MISELSPVCFVYVAFVMCEFVALCMASQYFGY